MSLIDMIQSAAQMSANKPLLMYGTDASYYTGKLEAYFRAKGIPYVLEPFTPSGMKRCEEHTGLVQIPQVELPDGNWLVDTTLIIEFYERELAQPGISPALPALAFVSRLLEDYADEWLWRPAMHYRWSFPATAQLMSAWLAEHIAEISAPQWMKRWYWRQRQYRTFVAGDGVTKKTRAVVESSYLETLAALESIFAVRPFVLGERPTEADFGFFGPLFRHFSCDPAPARIMRERAPGVYAWVARMWNLQPERVAAQPLPDRIPDDLGPLLQAIAEIYLPYLQANAIAYANAQRSVSYEVRGVSITEPVKPYRVWCKDRLHKEFSALDERSRAEVTRVLDSSTAVDCLLTPSPKAGPDKVGCLPITTPPQSKGIDSWWR